MRAFPVPGTAVPACPLPRRAIPRCWRPPAAARARLDRAARPSRCAAAPRSPTCVRHTAIPARPGPRSRGSARSQVARCRTRHATRRTGPSAPSRVQTDDHVAAIAAGEARCVRAVRITDDGPVAASQGGCQQFADGGGLTGTGGADKIEVLKFIGWRDGSARQSQPAVGRVAGARRSRYQARCGSMSAPRRCVARSAGRRASRIASTASISSMSSSTVRN